MYCQGASFPSVVFRNGNRADCSVLPIAASPCFPTIRWDVVKAATIGMRLIFPTGIWILAMCSLIHDGVPTGTEQRAREPRRRGVGVEEILAIKLGK